MQTQPNGINDLRPIAAVDPEIAAVDPEIAAVISAETERQETHLELIASENIASRAVMAAQGSVLTNKYA